MNNWSRALIYIAKHLNDNNISYILVASGSLKVLGVNVNPYDIDIFTSEENVRKCFEIFKSIRTSELHYFQDKDGKYLEFQANLFETPIEFCEVKNLYNIEKEIIYFFDTGISISKNALLDELEANKSRDRQETVKAIEDFIAKN